MWGAGGSTNSNSQVFREFWVHVATTPFFRTFPARQVMLLPVAVASCAFSRPQSHPLFWEDDRELKVAPGYQKERKTLTTGDTTHCFISHKPLVSISLLKYLEICYLNKQIYGYSPITLRWNSDLFLTPGYSTSYRPSSDFVNLVMVRLPDTMSK